MNLLDTSVYSYVSECGTFDEAVARLDSSYVKPVNEVFTCHRLNTCQQTQGESVEDFLQRLKSLNNECNFVDSTAVQIKQAAIRDAFIAGLTSGYIRQRISEVNILSLNAVFDKARALNKAKKNSYIYEATYTQSRSRTQENIVAYCNPCAADTNNAECSAAISETCHFREGLNHKRANCPANH